VCQANDDVTIDHKMRARKRGVKQYKQTNNNNKQQQQNKQIKASVWVGPVLSYYAEWLGMIV